MVTQKSTAPKQNRPTRHDHLHAAHVALLQERLPLRLNEWTYRALQQDGLSRADIKAAVNTLVTGGRASLDHRDHCVIVLPITTAAHNN